MHAERTAPRIEPWAWVGLALLLGCATSGSAGHGSGASSAAATEATATEDDITTPVRVEPDSELVIQGATLNRGRVTPYGVSGGPRMMELRESTGDPSYGYTPQNPVRVGGRSEEAEVRYLSSLFGPEGQPIFYERIGSCCSTEKHQPLDAFRILYEGLGQRPLVLYLDVYELEEPRVPMGLRGVPVRP